MYCTKCGKENEDDAQFCTRCGQKLSIPSIPEVITNTSFETRLQTSQKAIWSLIMGLIGISCWCCCGIGIIAGAIAIVLGFLAKEDIRQNPTKLAGESLANAGLVLGIIDITINMVYIVINMIYKPLVIEEIVRQFQKYN